MKKYKGFTLVELLAIITILGVMVILVVPQIGGSINAKKEKELEKIIDIIENAGKTYHSFNNDVLKISIDTLVNEKYLTNDLTNPVTNEKLDGCVRVFKDNNDIYNYKYTPCEIQVSVTIDLKGGTSSQFSQEITQNTYDDSTKIELVDPTKQNSDFKKWQVVKGNSYINGKTLIVGDTETIVYAIWESWPTLTLNLNEGSLDQSLSSQYASGTHITLKTPTREGYTFAGWSVNEGEGNSIVSGNNFTMGSIDTILTANWTKNTYTISYNLDGGTNAEGNPTSGEYGSTVTINNPTRTGYTFAGWTASGASMSGTNLTIGASNVTLTANWTANTYTITYNLNGGTNAEGNPTTGTYGSIVTINNPTKVGYTFNGWTVTGASMSGTNLTIGASNVTLTANWLVKPESFEEDSWTTIASAVSSGNTDNYNVGDTKTVDLGSLGTHTVRIANKTACDGTLESQTACGFVIEFADIITTHTMNDTNTNARGWPASAMRTYVNGDIYNALPEGLRNAIIDTTVVSSHGSEDSSNFTSTDKVYFLSTREVWGKEGTSNQITSDSADGDTITRQLDYYKNNNVTTSNYSGAIKQNSSGSASYWWLRSAYSGNRRYFYYVDTSGDWNDYGSAYGTNGVSPAFRLG